MDTLLVFALIVALCYVTDCFAFSTTITRETEPNGRPVEYTRRHMHFQKGPVRFVIGSFVGRRWLDEARISTEGDTRDTAVLASRSDT